MSTLRPVRKQQSSHEPTVDAVAVWHTDHSLQFVSSHVTRLTGFSDADFNSAPGLWIRQTHSDDRTALVGLADSEACCAAIRVGDNHVGIGIDLAREILRRYRGDVFFRKESERKGQAIIQMRGVSG